MNLAGWDFSSYILLVKVVTLVRLSIKSWLGAFIFMDLRFSGALIGSEMDLFTVGSRSGGRVENHGISVCKDCK